MNSLQLYLNRSKRLLFILAFGILGYLPIVSQASCTLTHLNTGTVIESGRFGAIMSTVVQNQPAVAQVDYMYQISCPDPSSRVRIEIIDDISQSQFYQGIKASIDTFKKELQPTLFSIENVVRFIPEPGSGGQILRTTFDIANDKIVGDVGVYYYQGPLVMTLVLSNGNKYLFSNLYKPNMREYVFEIHPVTIEMTDSSGTRKNFLFMGDNFQSSKNKCNVEGFTVTATPNVIDFGDMSKQSLEQGEVRQRDFSLNMTRNESNCNVALRPKVTFVSEGLLTNNNKDIKLSNGLLLSLKDVASGQPIEIGKAFEYTNRIEGSHQIKYRSEIRKSPGDTVKTGPFTTALVYLVEYY